MRKPFFSLIFLLLPLASFAQQDTLSLAQQLIKNKKYESAMNLLNAADANNDRPDYVIAKTDLVLNYFVSSIMHQIFALKDLKPNEDVKDYRGKLGTYSMFFFAPDSLLNRLKSIYPDNYKIHKTLGDFYRKVDLDYENWLSDSVLDYMYDNYKTAYEHGIYDANSLFSMGYYFLLNESYENCIPCFEKALELDPQHADAHYNVAYAYIYLEKPDMAIPHVKKSLKLYKDKGLKSDAARMLGVICLEQKDYNTALKYFKQSDKLFPYDLYTQMYILDAQLALNDKKYTETTEKIFNIEPGHPSICYNLTERYISVDKAPELVSFFLSKIQKSSSDEKALGNIYYSLGDLYKNLKEKDKAKDAYRKAKEYFQKAEYGDEEFYQTLDENIKELQ